ncbi:MAG: hypothetical protein JXA14_08150 [Anaerolineae bacterium]|nr:hypothetical protein [Anaerolineae bacterium]
MGGNGRAIRYLVYRNGGEDLAALLGLALADHQGRTTHPLAGIVVHKTAIDRACAALKALGVGDLPVTGGGGCLVGEVWLVVDGADGNTAL